MPSPTSTATNQDARLVHFITELTDYQTELGYNQFWRWKKAPPRILNWLVERPSLLEALLRDAQEQKTPGEC